MSTDEELLRRFAHQRDEAAFTEVVRRRVDFVYAVALRQVGGDAHLAQDAVQAVFLDLARKAQSIAALPALVSWLYTATRFAAAKVRRRQTRWLNREQEALTMKAILSDGTDPAWETLRPVLDDVMHELDEKDRTAILLRYFENRPLAEVGGKLGLAENSARMRVDRALDKLRDRLAQRGIASTAAALGSVLAAQPAATAPIGLAVTTANAALTAVVSGSAKTGILFLIMTPSKNILIAAVAIALLGTTAYQIRLGDRRAKEIQDLQRQLSASRSRETQARRDSAEATVAKGPASKVSEIISASAKASQTTSASPVSPTILPANPQPNDFSQLWSLKIMQRSVQASLGYIFDYFDPGGPVMRSQLQELMVQRAAEEEAAALRGRQLGIRSATPEYAPYIAAQTERVVGEIRTLLGENYTTFDELYGLRGAMNYLAERGTIGSDMAFYHESLSPETRVQLARLMTEIHFSFADPMLPGMLREPVDPATGLQPVFGRLLERSVDLLSPAQQKILRAYQDEIVAGQNRPESKAP